MSAAEPPPRYAPEIPFPPYAFVPGRHPHPVTDPAGHSFGQREESLPVPEADSLADDPRFRFGVDLFNHGYYWEAHETWEGLWLACGRRGRLADFLKALIRLAATGVKAREGNPAGVLRHAQRARELFTQINHPPLMQLAQELINSPPHDATPTTEGNPVLSTRLLLDDLFLPEDS